MRLAPDAVAQDAAKREVAAYQHLQELQGVHLPRLLAYGHILSGSVFFVATELVKVCSRSFNPELKMLL